MTEQAPLSWEDVWGFLEELKEMARALLGCESNAQSIQATGLVLSALRRQKRADQEWHEVRWEDRDEFFRDSHRAMRQALIDHARKRKAKRGRVPVVPLPPGVALDDFARSVEFQPERVECLANALDDFETADPKLARVVQHAMYSKLSIPEIARLVDASENTVRARLRRASAWLRRRMKETCPELVGDA